MKNIIGIALALLVSITKESAVMNTNKALSALLMLSLIGATACGNQTSALSSATLQKNAATQSGTYISSNPASSSSGTTTVSGATTSTTTNTSSTSTSTVADDSAPVYLAGGSDTAYQALLGSSLSLYAQFEAGTQMTYQWYKDGAAVSGGTDTTLTIASVTKATYGAYTLRATNRYGQAQSTPIQISPKVVLLQLGSSHCNGYQCWADQATAVKACQVQLGPQAQLQTDTSWAPAYIKWTNKFCSWNNGAWACNMSCDSSCQGDKVLGWVQCIQ